MDILYHLETVSALILVVLWKIKGK